MTRDATPPLGLPPFGVLGRVVAILLLTVLIEFGVSTALYERSAWLPLRGVSANGRVLLALAAAVALMALGGAMVRRTLLPLRRLSDAADQVGAGEPATPIAVPTDGPGEVRRVVAAFNRMQARIARLIGDRTQALAAVGHDLRTPLARLRLRAEAIGDPEVRAAVAADVAEMDAMVASLLDFLGGDSDPERPVRIDLAVLCASAVDEAVDRGREARYVGPDHLERTLRPLTIKRALANLVENALQYGDTVTVTLIDAADGATIRVEDDGPGIAEDRLERAVQPFVRLDPARHRDTKGFGLGLAIVAGAAASEGGRLVLSNRPEGGLRAELRGLAADQSAAACAAPPAVGRRANQTITTSAPDTAAESANRSVEASR